MNALYQDKDKKFQSYMLSTPAVNIAASDVYDARLTLDSSFSFEAHSLYAYCTGEDVTVEIEYNSNDKLTNGETYLQNIAIMNGKGDVRFFPFMVLPNSSVKIRLTNKGASAVYVQLSFAGKRFVS